MPATRLAGASEIEYRKLWIGAAAGGATYLVAYFVALSLGVLAVASTAISRNEPTALAPASAIPENYVSEAWTVLGQLAAQLLPLAHLGSLSWSAAGSVPFIGQVRAEGSASLVPWLLLAGCMVTAWLSGRIAESRVSSRTRVQLWAQAVVAGGVFSILVNVIAVSASVALPPVGGFRIEPITAAGFWPVVWAFAAATIMSWLGRRSASERPEPGYWRWTASNGVRTIGMYVAVFFVVAVPAVWITAGVKAGWAGALSAPVWVLNAAGYMFVDGHFGGLQAVARTSQFGANTATSPGGSGYFYGVAGTLEAMGLPAWAAWLLVLLSLAAVIVSSLCLLLSRGSIPTTGVGGWLPVPLAFAALGLVVTFLLWARMRIDMPGLFAADYSMAPAFWFPAVMALWGVLVEAAARYVAPYVLPFIPRRIQSLLVPGNDQASPEAAPAWAGPDAGLATGPGVGLATGPGVGLAVTAAPSPTAAARTGTAAQAGAWDSVNAESRPSPDASIRKTLSPQQRKRVLAVLVSALGAGVLVASALIAVNMVKAANGPDELAGSYLQALVDGDADKALQISDPDIPVEERPLLSNAVYAKAAKRIDGYSVISTTVTGDSAIVRAELRQSGRKTEVAYNLAKVDPALLNDNWKLTANAAQRVTLTVDAAVEAINVNGVEVPVRKDPGAFSVGSTISLPAFPGEYTVALAAQEKYLTAKEAKAFVTISLGKQTAEAAHLKTEGNEAFQAEVDRQVDAALAACASSDKLIPSGCPFYTYAFGDVRGVKWSVTRKPSYQVTRYSNGKWRLSDGAAGQVTVNYERNFSWDKNKPEWKPDSATDEFTVRGTVGIDGGKVVVELSRY